MTERERAQVVELLLCAADENPVMKPLPNGLGAAEVNLMPDMTIACAAWDAYYAVKTEQPGMYRHELLEAAARVHLHEWPTEGGE